MKKFTKVMLIIAAVFVGIGIICMFTSVALGLTWEGLDNMVAEGKFNFGNSNVIENGASSAVDKITEECTELDIEFGAGTLEIKYQGVDNIEVSQLDVRGYKCYVKDGTLHVQGGKGAGIGGEDGRLIITLPYEYIFEEVDIEIGAGKATIEQLYAKEIDVQVGAGKLEMMLSGVEEDYNYDIECGVGSIQIGTTTYTGLGYENDVVNPGATKHLNVECGAGAVTVQFAQEL